MEAQGVSSSLGDAPLQPMIEAFAAADARSERHIRTATRRSRREHEVLQRLSDGDTDRQIAAALFISEKTASVHVSNVIRKLGVSNRGQAADVAHGSGPVT